MKQYISLLLIPFITGCRVNDLNLTFDLDIPEEHFVDASSHAVKISDYEKWWEQIMAGAPEELLELAKESNPDIGMLTEKINELLSFYGITKENFFAEPEEGKAQVMPKMQRMAPGAISIEPMTRNIGIHQHFGNQTSSLIHNLQIFRARFEVDFFKRSLYYQNAAVEEIWESDEQKNDFLSFLKTEILREVLCHRHVLKVLQELKERSEKNLEYLEKMRIRTRYALHTKEELAKAEEIAEAFEAKFRQYTREEKRHVHALMRLTGINDQSVVRELLNDHNSLREFDHEIITDTPLTLIHRRPDIRAARRRVNKAGFLVGMSASEKFPKLYFTANLETLTNQVHQLFSLDNLSYLFGLNITNNFLHRWQDIADEKVKKAQFNAAVHDYKKSITGALTDVSDLALNLLDSRDMHIRSQKVLKQTIDHLNVEEKGYAYLNASVFKVIEANYNAFLAKESHLSACQQNSQNVIALVRSLGM